MIVSCNSLFSDKSKRHNQFPSLSISKKFLDEFFENCYEKAVHTLDFLQNYDAVSEQSRKSEL